MGVTKPAADTCPYGPASNPTAGVSAATVNPGGTVTVTGSNFSKSSTVQMTITPVVATFPRNLTSNTSGVVSLSFAAPSTAQTYTITLTDLLTGVPPSSGGACGGVAQTTFTVADAGSGGPTTTAAAGSGGGGGALPTTGSDVASWLRMALVLVLAGAGLIVVGVTRRRRSN